MTDDYLFELPLRTEAELKIFVKKAWGIDIPDVKVCPTHSTPWRAFCDAYFARHPVIVWKASRGFGGKSYALGLLGLTEGVTLKADVNILGGSGEQAKRVLGYNEHHWEYPNAPRHLLRSEPGKTETKLSWGNMIKALMASQTSVRGPHPQRLRIDEGDEVKLEILDAALGQAMERDGVLDQTVISSTHQYPDGTFTEVLKRVTEKGWGLHEWCYKENLEPHGWLAPEAVERKRATVTQSMWDVEYELQEPSPENRAINAQSVQAMFRWELGSFPGEVRQYIEIEPPKAEGKYAHGADWARTKDFTVIITYRIDVKPMRIVAFERTQKETWPIMIGKLEKRVARYGGRGAHDATGLGDVVEGFLNSPKIKPIIMRGNDRRSLLSEYIAGIENGEIESPDIEYMKAQHLYATYDKLYGDDHLPDTISAGALGYRASTLPEGVLLG